MEMPLAAGRPRLRLKRKAIEVEACMPPATDLLLDHSPLGDNTYEHVVGKKRRLFAQASDGFCVLCLYF